MDRKILFISKYPDIVKEFLAAMEGKEIQIDTASNGIEAAGLLKKNIYQVVITGLSLDGYNGEQIITYLNKNFHNTVCIIYTTTISPAQLHFFMNAREVFRVFLRPVDFQKEFYGALEEAFEFYEVRKANEEEDVELEQLMQHRIKEIPNLKEKVKTQKRALPYMLPYAKRMLKFSLETYGKELDVETKKKILEAEWEVANLCLGESEQRSEDLLKASQRLTQMKSEI